MINMSSDTTLFVVWSVLWFSLTGVLFQLRSSGSLWVCRTFPQVQMQPTVRVGPRGNGHAPFETAVAKALTLQPFSLVQQVDGVGLYPRS
jgi:hypothetical protein